MKRAMLLWVILFLLAGRTSCALTLPSPQSGATTLDNLLLVLWVSHRYVNVNQPVTIRFTVTNEGKQTVVYDRRDKPVADIIIDPPPGSGKSFFTGRRWSDGKPLTSELTRLELKPGESRVLEMIWMPGEEYRGGLLRPVSITGMVWWCAERETCYNQVGLGLVIE